MLLQASVCLLANVSSCLRSPAGECQQVLAFACWRTPAVRCVRHMSKVTNHAVRNVRTNAAGAIMHVVRLLAKLSCRWCAPAAETELQLPCAFCRNRATATMRLLAESAKEVAEAYLAHLLSPKLLEVSFRLLPKAAESCCSPAAETESTFCSGRKLLFACWRN